VQRIKPFSYSSLLDYVTADKCIFGSSAPNINNFYWIVQINFSGKWVREKISTAENAETAERFLPKDQKKKSFYAYFTRSASSRFSAAFGPFLFLRNQIVCFSGSSAVEDKRMTEEEAESAEVLF
jgi:hypothetical protein